MISFKHFYETDRHYITFRIKGNKRLFDGVKSTIFFYFLQHNLILFNHSMQFENQGEIRPFSVWEEEKVLI